MPPVAEEARAWDGDGVPLEDSNVEGIGSDEDKAARKEAAQAEPAWEGVGGESGLWVWRVEDFNVVRWPEDRAGTFYTGDSYVILSSASLEDGDLVHDIFFWLGEKTSADEKGTAAYKTVELDDLLDGAATQHREVMGAESAEFLELFPSIEYLDGGVESAFDPVTPDVYESKLLQVQRTSQGMKVREVPRSVSSMHHTDCFVLDAGDKAYVWCGNNSSPFEAQKANSEAEALESRRFGKCTATRDLDDRFWELLGGSEDDVSAEEGERPAEMTPGEGVLYKLSDSLGDLTCEEVGRGELTADMLSSEDVMMVDDGCEVLLWIGAGANAVEARNSMRIASRYLSVNGKPSSTPISILKEATCMKSPKWKRIFGTA